MTVPPQPFNQPINGGICVGGVCSTSASTTITCGLFGCNAQTSTGPITCITCGGPFGQRGGGNTPPGGSVFGGNILEVTLAVAAAFMTVAVFAGIFGAGSLANIIAALGIIFALVTFINGIIFATFAFSGALVIITLLLNIIVDPMYIYLIWTTLVGRGGVS